MDHLFGFTGRPNQTDTGLQNNLGRWYDPIIASWTSEDPISFRGGDANLYRYCGNDPVNFVDPNGLEGSRAWQLMRKEGLGPAAQKGAKSICKGANKAAQIAAGAGEGADRFVGDFYRGAAQATAESVQQTEAMGQALVDDPFGTAGNMVSGTVDSALNADENIPAAVGSFLDTMINGDNVEKSNAWCKAMATIFGSTRGNFGKRPKKPRGSRGDSPGLGKDKSDLGRDTGPTVGDGVRVLDADKLRKLDIPWGEKMRSGCEKVAKDINQAIGGTIHRLKPKRAGYLGPRDRWETGWPYHDVNVKNGLVYDVLTGIEGMPIAEFKNLWDYADEIDFGF